MEFNAGTKRGDRAQQGHGERCQTDDSPELKEFQVSFGAGDARLLLLPPGKVKSLSLSAGRFPQ